MRSRLIAVAVLLASSAAWANRATVELVADRTAAPAGGTVTVALHFAIDPDWHLYWTNPGDTGVPPKVKWTLPPGVSAGELRFPTPHRMDADGLTIFGYHDELTLLTDITVAPDVKAPVEIKGDVKWVVCADVCIAERQPVTLTLPVGPGEPNAANQFAVWRAQQPDRKMVEQTIAATFDADGKTGAIEVPLPSPDVTPIDFFPPALPAVVYGKPESVTRPDPANADNKGAVRVYRLPFRVLPEPPADFTGKGVIVLRRSAAGTNSTEKAGGKDAAIETTFTFRFPHS